MFTHPSRRWIAAILVAGAIPATLSACGSPDSSASSGASSSTVTLVTHDSFAVSPSVLKQFEKQTGLTVKRVAPGDAGTLVNQLILTKNNPLGDAVFGIDNSFASRVIDEGVLADFTATGMPSSADAYQVDKTKLTPIDVGDVCVNADKTWFADHKLAVPTTLDDLAKPAYKNLLVVENPATSSPGLAFLLATIGRYGDDGWKDYWSKLKANGVKVDASWSDAYDSDFSGADGKGPRPLVVSYSTSPAFTLSKDKKSSNTTALLDTCYRQVEYAGVLKGAKNPKGAAELVQFLTEKTFQADVAPSMYMYPVDSSVALPPAWQEFAPLSPKPWTVPAAEVSKNRDTWIKQWTDTVVG